MDNHNQKVPLGEFVSVLDLCTMIQAMRQKQRDYFNRANHVTLAQCRMEELKVQRAARRVIELGFPAALPVLTLGTLEAQKKVGLTMDVDDVKAAILQENALDAMVHKILSEARAAAKELEEWNKSIVNKPKS